MTEQEKPIAIILPSWDPNEPRFIVDECPKCSDDRQFKNGKCVYNQRLGFCYSVDEIVEVLNNTDLEDKIKKVNQLIDDFLQEASDMQAQYYLKRLKEELEK